MGKASAEYEGRRLARQGARNAAEGASQGVGATGGCTTLLALMKCRPHAQPRAAPAPPSAGAPTRTCQGATGPARAPQRRSAAPRTRRCSAVTRRPPKRQRRGRQRKQPRRRGAPPACAPGRWKGAGPSGTRAEVPVALRCIKGRHILVAISRKLLQHVEIKTNNLILLKHTTQ